MSTPSTDPSWEYRPATRLEKMADIGRDALVLICAVAAGAVVAAAVTLCFISIPSLFSSAILSGDDAGGALAGFAHSWAGVLGIIAGAVCGGFVMRAVLRRFPSFIGPDRLVKRPDPGHDPQR